MTWLLAHLALLCGIVAAVVAVALRDPYLLGLAGVVVLVVVAELLLARVMPPTTVWRTPSGGVARRPARAAEVLTEEQLQRWPWHPASSSDPQA